jgi:hypothetical protein
MYRSIFHRHDVLNGYVSYWPSGFAERMALAERLPDPDALAELRRETGLAYIWVHGRDLAESRTAWNAIAREGRGYLTLVTSDGGELLFAVKD